MKFLSFLWSDEEGSAGRDIAVILAVAACAGLVWFQQIGGETGLSEVLYAIQTGGRNVTVLPR